MKTQYRPASCHSLTAGRPAANAGAGRSQKFTAGDPTAASPGSASGAGVRREPGVACALIRVPSLLT